MFKIGSSFCSWLSKWKSTVNKLVKLRLHLQVNLLWGGPTTLMEGSGEGFKPCTIWKTQGVLELMSFFPKRCQWKWSNEEKRLENISKEKSEVTRMFLTPVLSTFWRGRWNMNYCKLEMKCLFLFLTKCCVFIYELM